MSMCDSKPTPSCISLKWAMAQFGSQVGFIFGQRKFPPLNALLVSCCESQRAQPNLPHMIALVFFVFFIQRRLLTLRGHIRSSASLCSPLLGS